LDELQYFFNPHYSLKTAWQISK